ncbi:MAG: ribonuclease HIII [Bacilli bacterium]|nr:ribonuclease HIII [Bacilli bacterium]
MSATTVSLSLDKATVEKLVEFYAPIQQANPSPYHIFFAKSEGGSISVYAEKKGMHKVVFQGEKAEEMASSWGVAEVKPIIANKPQMVHLYKWFDQIGSDEVGTGDFFGPICVCAALVKEKDRPRLTELGIMDSKKMSDEDILSLGPTLINEFEYSQCSIDNEKYNEVNEKGLNMNAIKAKMHNQVLLNLHKKHPDIKLVQDQFAEPKTYYGYLKGEKEVARDILFSVKGETAFLSVALASVIARYSFLRKMQAMNEKYGVDFPFGAAEHVTEFARSFAEKFGLDELRKITKTNFANYKKIIQ